MPRQPQPKDPKNMLDVTTIWNSKIQSNTKRKEKESKLKLNGEEYEKGAFINQNRTLTEGFNKRE